MDYRTMAFHQRVAKVMTSYYSLPECVPTSENYKLWLESLQEPMKSSFMKKSFDYCCCVLNYRRFILELADVGMDEYFRTHLSEQDYLLWKKGE